MKRNQLALATAAAVAAASGGSIAQEVAVPAPQIEEVFVLGEFIPDEKRDTSEISNVVGVEDMNIVPETTVGATLSRVAGLSLVGGKYVYIRGLGERYSSTLLNRSRLSSPVPFQKTVPLDIVPNNIVESLLVQKTYSAQYPGDFSGGVVDIRTKPLPEENYFTVKLQAGGNSETTNGDGIFYRGGGDDNWGTDDGTRDIPGQVNRLTSEEFESLPNEAKGELGKTWRNNWDILEKDVKPNYAGEVEGGYRWDLDNGMAFGVIGNVKYRNFYENTIKDLARYEFTGVDGGSNQTVDYTRWITRQRIDLTGFLNLGLEINDNNTISFTSAILRQTDDELQQDRGISSEDNVDDGVPVESYRMQWTENEIKSFDLSGEHYFPDLNDALLEWRIVDGSGSREQPDSRTYTYAANNDGNLAMVTQGRQAAGDLRDVFQAPERFYSDLEDEIEEYGIDFELPLNFLESTVKVGWADYERSRETVDRLFRFDLSPLAPDFVALQTPQQFFSDTNWDRDYLRVRDFSASQANASGIFPFAESSEEISAFYASWDFLVLPTLRLQLGVRQEETDIVADAWGGNTEPGTENFVEQDYSDTLPAVSATWEFLENMQVRFAWSETVNRPSLLEVTGSTLINPEDQQLYRGNVFLEQAEVENFDIRWEWYFGAGDEMSVGLFYKEFTDPIELAKVQAQNDIFTWFNAEEGDLTGVEIDVRKELLFGEWFGLDPMWNSFNLSFNMSFIDSEVTLLGNGETAEDVPLTGGRRISPLFENERRFTGQSDVLANAILSYQDESGWTGSIAYNFTGDRIVLVGDFNAPDIIEEDFHRVDVLLKYDFELGGQMYQLEAKAANILDEEFERTQGGQLWERWDPGITYSFGFRATF
ncbi:MAG: TonB-dependent receptor [Pseudomonadota bacterium]